eukprot:scaffold7763_cov46-Phaeocystis_antarctica.AAC.4
MPPAEMASSCATTYYLRPTTYHLPPTTYDLPPTTYDYTTHDLPGELVREHDGEDEGHGGGQVGVITR